MLGGSRERVFSDITYGEDTLTFSSAPDADGRRAANRSGDPPTRPPDRPPRRYARRQCRSGTATQMPRCMRVRTRRSRRPSARGALASGPVAVVCTDARETPALDDLREHPARKCGRPLSPGESRRVRAGRRRSCGSSLAGVSHLAIQTLACVGMRRSCGARASWFVVVIRAAGRRSVRRSMSRGAQPGSRFGGGHCYKERP